MTRSSVFRRAARAEFFEAAEWYDAQRLGLGAEFIAEIERCVKSATEGPDRYP